MWKDPKPGEQFISFVSLSISVVAFDALAVSLSSANSVNYVFYRLDANVSRVFCSSPQVPAAYHRWQGLQL